MTPEVELSVQDKLTSCAPAPESETDCVLLLAVSAMVSEAVLAPEAEGVNRIAMVQLLPAASLLSQK